ncbi:MAG TPA: hypothetical protein VNM24_06240 [Burkholderiales bacterium]|jgi:hypothetical protein|nr:hypothetical protein [Burkholderiales bacterium]
MRVTVLHAVIAAMAVAIAALTWTLVYFARDELRFEQDAYEEQIRVASHAGEADGRAIVRIPATSQAASGIAVQPLAPAASENTVEVYGAVVGLQALLEMRGRYLAASAELRARRAAAAAAQAEYRRMQALYRDDRNVSEQALASAEARFKAESAQLAAAQAAVETLADALHTTWGKVIAEWVRRPDSPELRALLDRRLHLVQMSFPFELPRAAARNSLLVAPLNAYDKARSARYVSEAPQAQAVLPGQTFFYLVEGGDLRAGTRVVGRVAMGGRENGVLVPGSAVVWHAGKAWVYVRQDGETFARYAVQASREMGDGWFNPAGDLEPGQEVVVSGAQLLLSEELKFQIRNENED